MADSDICICETQYSACGNRPDHDRRFWEVSSTGITLNDPPKPTQYEIYRQTYFKDNY